jgi:hypothetical protein
MKLLTMASFLVLFAVIFSIMRDRAQVAETVAAIEENAIEQAVYPTEENTVLVANAENAAEQPLRSAQENASGQVFFVSRDGSNGDGLSWATAWNELDQINWDIVDPGEIIYIDGGNDEMRYETEMVIGSSGTENAPIQILAAAESGHNGQIVFFGGRDNDLPYCGQRDYEAVDAETLRQNAIQTNDKDYIVIDGQRWSGIKIHGFGDAGLLFAPESDRITVRYVEIYNNGEAEEESDGWNPGTAGVRLAGEDITLQRVIIHDNGQDAIQSLDGDNQISNFRLEQSWLYNGRRHPEVNESANWCTHTDGIQLYDGGEIAGITITESIIGPGFTQGVLLGQDRTDNGSWAEVSNVTFRDVLFMKAADNNVIGYRDTDASNWVLDRVTIDCVETKSHCIRIENSNHTLQNSIIINGLITFPNDLDTYSGNCQWNTEGFDIGEEVDPQFANVTEDMFSLDDYTPAQDSPCEGSRIGSVEALMALD